jgi:hypothetical protein
MDSSFEDNRQIINGLTPSEAILIHGKLFAERKRPYKLVFFLVIFLLFPTHFIYKGIQDTKKAISSRDFLPAKARIISSNIKSEETGRQQIYVLYIKVAYSVQGNNYYSKDLSPGSKDDDSFTLLKGSKIYSYGREITVYYNKKNPAEISLKQGVHAVDFVGIIISVAILIIVLIIIISYIPLLK